jgi:hypothetical protein
VSLQSNRAPVSTASEAVATGSVYDDTYSDVAGDVAGDVPTEVQTLTKQMHASAFLSEFLQSQQATRGTCVKLAMVRNDIGKWERHSSALVKYVMLKLSDLMRRKHITFPKASADKSKHIIVGWQDMVAACSKRAHAKLQQVRGTIASYFDSAHFNLLHFRLYLYIL